MAKKAKADVPDSEDTVVSDQMQSEASADPTDVDTFAGMITEAWRASVGGIVAVGRLLMRAKAELPHGQFGLLFKEKKVPFSDRTGERLMEVAQHPIISDPTHGSVLPPHWRTLHAMTKIPAEQLKKLIADRTIHGETERKDIEKIAKEYDPMRILDALSTLLEFQSDWPEPKNLVAELMHRGTIDTDTLLLAGARIGNWLSLLGQAWSERAPGSGARTVEQPEQPADGAEQTDEVSEAMA